MNPIEEKREKVENGYAMPCEIDIPAHQSGYLR